MHSRENVRRSLVALIIPNLAPTNMTPDEIVQRAFDIADCYLKHTGSSDAGSPLPADDDQASGAVQPSPTPEVAPSDPLDPFNVAFAAAIEEGERGDEILATRIRAAIKSTKTPEQAKQLLALMKGTKDRRSKILDEALRDELYGEAREQYDSFR